MPNRISLFFLVGEGLYKLRLPNKNASDENLCCTDLDQKPDWPKDDLHLLESRREELKLLESFFLLEKIIVRLLVASRNEYRNEGKT